MYNKNLKAYVGAVGATKLTAIFIMACILGVSAFLAVGNVFADPSAILYTTNAEGIDQGDFAPGDVVYIHGIGFNPTSSVEITVTRPDSQSESCTSTSCNWRFNDGVQQSSDAEGDFVYAYDLDGIVGEYTITVSDGITTKTATFIDARNIDSATLNGAGSVTVAPSTSITAAVTVTTTGSGSDNNWESTAYLIEGGSWQCVNTPDHGTSGGPSGTFTESFSITAPATPGVYDVSFRAYSNPTCNNGQSNTLTLTNGITVTSPYVCGDGKKEGTEGCDDGNTANGDGCNSGCQVETGWSCTGTQPSVCTPVCGNGIITSPETCDDGNTASSDGCSNVCQIETGWSCSGTPSVCYATNPQLSSSCGIDMALVIDVSGSIDSTELAQMKSALSSFVDAFLPNTPTKIAVVKFDTTATIIHQYSNDATSLKNAINGASGGGYTNWQDALYDTHSLYDHRLDKPDLYVFASDGEPNRYGDPATTATTPVAVAHAVTEANHIKLHGIRIITLGIGTGGSSSLINNLKAISSADAYYDTDFATLAQTLADLANDFCGGTVSVKKLVDGQPAANWVFTTSVTGGTSTPTTSTTDVDGFINPLFDIEAGGGTATVDVTETVMNGYSFVNAHCYKNQVEVGTPGAATVTGIPVGSNDAIYCEFNNHFVPCTAYTSSTECNNDNRCQWCEQCSDPYINGLGIGFCYEQDDMQACQYSACAQICGAACDENSDCSSHCDGIEYNFAGACGSGCTCTYTQENCADTDACTNDLCDNGKGCYYTDVNCDDSNPCTVDSCNPASGCVHDAAAANGYQCDDGQYCTINDVCQDGSCVGGGARDCSVLDNQCQEGVCNENTNQCEPDYTYYPLSTSCEADQNLCTIDHCDGSGSCVNYNNVDCSGLNDQCQVGVCNPSDGQCYPSYANYPLSTPCNNGLYCDGSDHCNGAGSCVNLGPAVDCSRLNGQCQAGVCNEATDQCAPDYTSYPLSTPCQADQDYCTVDHCDGSGTCMYNYDYDCSYLDDECGIGVCESGDGPTCRYQFSDTLGPQSYNVLVDPTFNNGVFNLTGTAKDNCSEIKISKYYLGTGIGSCDDYSLFSGAMDPADGGYDELLEDLKKMNLQYRYDGQNFACIKSWDVLDNVGNCNCTYFDTDVLPPDCPYDIYLDDVKYPDEYMLCGNNAWLNATVCDSQSPIQGGEYFIDPAPNTVPEPWSGIWMNVLEEFIDGRGWHCAIIGAPVDTSQLSDGTHYIKIRGKDIVENWGKFLQCMNVSFIKDTTPPLTTKTMTGVKHECTTAEKALYGVDDCWFVKGGMQITLTAHDFNPDNGANGGYNDLPGEYSDQVKIYYQVGYKLNWNDPEWIWSPVTLYNGPFTLNEDSFHMIKYWSEDDCVNKETPKYELDIVDTKAPNGFKTIGEPNITCTPDQGCDYWVRDDVTPITLDCIDQQPHPSDHEKMCYRISFDAPQTPYLTSQYCSEFQQGGYMEGDWCCVDKYAVTGAPQLPYTFTFMEDSLHDLEYYCEDVLGNRNPVDVEYFRVDSIPPEIIKGVEGPSYASYGTCPPQTPNDICYLDGVTNITVNMFDPDPTGRNCNVGGVTCEWGYYLDGNRQTFYGWYSTFPVHFPEETSHELHIRCRDALGNEMTEDVETFYVDKTPPTITKTYGYPRYPDDTYHPKWITLQTSITLTVEDTGPHKSGIQETKYRVTLMPDNSYCEDQLVCEGAQGTGAWTDYTVPFTIADDSCHLIEYYSKDNVEKTDGVHKQCVYVDNKAPVSVKDLGTPKHACTPEEQAMYYFEMSNPTDGCYFITQNTPITLTCTDQNPHPVDHVQIKYKDYLVGEGEPVEWTVVDNDHVTIYKSQDSTHVLKWYCVDVLGNAENLRTEYDIVETVPPEEIKTVGQPNIPIQQGQQIVLNFDELTGQAPLPTNYAGLTWSPGWEYYDWPQPPFYNAHSSPVRVYSYEYVPYVQFPQPVTFDGVWFAGGQFGRTVQFYGYNGGNLVGTSSILTLTGTPTWLAANFPGPVDKVEIRDAYNPAPYNDFVMDDFTYTTVDKYWVRDHVTPITLDCDDSWDGQKPHPVDHEKMCYRVSFDDPATPWLTTQYCTQFGGAMEGDWCCDTGEGLPYTFTFQEDSLHDLEYYCVDELGNKNTVDVEYFKVDSTPPEITKTIDGPYYGDCLPEETNDVCYLDGVTNIIVNAYDPDPTGRGCNVGGVTCEWGYYLDQDPTFYGWYSTFPVHFPEETKHELHIKCQDALGNPMPEDVEVFYVDKTPPTTTKSYGTPIVDTQGGYPKWITNQTQITLTVDDTGPHKSGIKETKYRVTLVPDLNCYEACIEQGSGAWNTYSAPFTIPEDSCHLIEYYSVDNVDKTETTRRQCVFVDNKPPVSTKTFDGLHVPCSELTCANQGSCDYYINQNTQIILSCTDQNPHPVDDVKIYYRYFVDDVLHQDWTQYTGPIQYNEDTNHRLEWYCVDALGNTEQTHTQVERVDTTPPVTTKTIGDPKWDNGYWVTSQTPITLSVTDGQYPCAAGPSTLYYQVWWDHNCDGTVDTKQVDSHVHTDANCNLNKTLYLEKECLHEIRWYSVDALGNIEDNNGQWFEQQHKVDNTPPHILILKPVDGWYSSGEDLPIVAEAKDLNNANGPCESHGYECNELNTNCAVGIADGAQCYAYLVDMEFLNTDPDELFDMNNWNGYDLITDGTFLYNAAAHECQGYATIPEDESLQDGIYILVVGAKDNLQNMANSFDEIKLAINEACGWCWNDPYDLCEPECIRDVVQDIITSWNLPKIGIDNHAPVVEITAPSENSLFGGEQVFVSADVSDSEDGQITSTITSGTPCYISIGGVSMGTVPYDNVARKCVGTVMIPEDSDFPQGTQALKVEIADNAGNLGSDSINVNVDTVKPVLSIIIPSQNQFVKGTIEVTAQVSDANLDASQIKISTDNGQTWHDTWYCNPSTYCYDWDTTLETDGMAYGLVAKATDLADNTGYSEVVIVIVDNGAPEGVYIVDPVKDEIVGGTITLKALATDYVSGVDSVTIYVNSPVPSFNCVATLVGGTWQCQFDSTLKLDGQHQVYAVATDNMGQTTTSASVPFIIDNDAPSTPVLSIYPATNGYDTDGVVTWQWTDATDAGSGIDYYVIEIGSLVYQSKVFGTMFTISDLSETSHCAQVKAVDKAGRESAWSSTLCTTVDKTPPSPVSIGVDTETVDKFVGGVYYDTDNEFDVVWNGGSDTNFDYYTLFENGAGEYQDNNDRSTRYKDDGTYTYYMKATDEAGWETSSGEITVVVDSVDPSITVSSPTGFMGLWTFTYSVSDPAPSSGIDRVEVSYADTDFVTCFPQGWCMVLGGTYVELTVYDKAGRSDSANTNGAPADTTPPMITYSSPSGVIDYNDVTLEVKTSELAKCYYGEEDNLEGMDLMSNDDSYGTNHWVDLGTLEDGLYVYHVQCEDFAGNMMEHSKTLVFFVNTAGQYCYYSDMSAGWNTFFLPQLILDDINFNCGETPYATADVLSSLEGKYSIIWYYDGQNWLSYDPMYPEYSTLTQFNDQISNPYYIKLTEPVRLGLQCDQGCQTCSAERTYTVNADFDEGTLNGLEHTTVADQLQLIQGETTTYPVMWIANAGEDTVSKFDTTNGDELARYPTWFRVQMGPVWNSHGGWDGAAPSRTAVDAYGNVYVANRQFSGVTNVIKIMANEADCVDRNSNGVIDTSRDLDSNGQIDATEVLPVVDNGNGFLDIGDFQDECVKWVSNVGSSGAVGRSLAIDMQGNIWVGLYYTSQYYKLSSVDGSILYGPISTGYHTPYGALVDKNGILWGASLSSNMLRLDTNTYDVQVISIPQGTYGIAIGYSQTGYTQVYLGGTSYTYTQYDSETGTLSNPAERYYYTGGLAVDKDGNIVAGCDGDGTVTKFAPDGSEIWHAAAQDGSGYAHGTVIDSNNDVWLVYLYGDKVAKYSGVDGTPLGAFNTGITPYTYSDATGLGLRSSLKVGTWDVVFNSEQQNTVFNAVSWNSDVPEESTMEVRVRSSNDMSTWSSWEVVTNGDPLTVPNGQYLEIESTMTSPQNTSPILFDLTVNGVCGGEEMPS